MWFLLHSAVGQATIAVLEGQGEHQAVREGVPTQPVCTRALPGVGVDGYLRIRCGE